LPDNNNQEPAVSECLKSGKPAGGDQHPENGFEGHEDGCERPPVRGSAHKMIVIWLTRV
jgi:hypothetical protein